MPINERLFSLPMRINVASVADLCRTPRAQFVRRCDQRARGRRGYRIQLTSDYWTFARFVSNGR